MYYAFDTRANTLFVGCLLGLVATGGDFDGWKPWAKRTLTGLALVSAGVMIWIIVNVGVGSRALPLWLLLPLPEAASAIIITYFLLQPRGLSTRALGIPVLVLLGNMSYAIYLLHWPVFVAISPFTVRWPFWLYETVRLVVILFGGLGQLVLSRATLDALAPQGARSGSVGGGWVRRTVRHLPKTMMDQSRQPTEADLARGQQGSNWISNAPGSTV